MLLAMSCSGFLSCRDGRRYSGKGFLFTSMLSPDQGGMLLPMPTRSDRDNPVADNSCVAVAFSASIVPESCYHRYVMMMVWSVVSSFPAPVFRAGFAGATSRRECLVVLLSAALADTCVSFLCGIVPTGASR